MRPTLLPTKGGWPPPAESAKRFLAWVSDEDVYEPELENVLTALMAKRERRAFVMGALVAASVIIALAVTIWGAS